MTRTPPPGPGPKNRLEASLLHRAMLLFQQVADWPCRRLLLLAMVPVWLVTLAWLLAGARWPGALVAGSLHLLFILADVVLLRALPRRGISFGPWQAQAAVLAVPRTSAALLLPLLPWPGSGWALAMLLALQALGSILLYWGAVVEPFRLSLTRLELALPGLAPAAPPLRLLHISDLHLERLTRRESRLLALAREAAPDLILLTGDYVNLSNNEDEITHRQVRRFLGQLEAPYGVYATLGSPPVDLPHVVPPLFAGLPVRLLRDEAVCVDVAGRGRLLLLGLDCHHEIETDGRRLARLVAGAPDVRPAVLLYHSPELMPQAAAQGIDLYLCGHTHGGQVRLPGIGALITSSQLGRDFVMGHYRLGPTHLYVSRGVGMEGLSAPRVRFLAPPEITLITLRGPAGEAPRA